MIDVWRVDLAAVADGLEELLCAQERARAQRIVRERTRVLWARSRGVLRVLLGRYLDRDPRELCFELGAHGKPTLRKLVEPEARPGERRMGPGDGLRFNLSHSGELMLVAVTAGLEVGVDIERVRKRYTPELLRAWTMREAAGKCLGTGLGAAPVAPAGSAVAGAEIWTAELDVGPGAAAAVAVKRAGGCELRRGDTTPTLTP